MRLGRVGTAANSQFDRQGRISNRPHARTCSNSHAAQSARLSDLQGRLAPSGMITTRVLSRSKTRKRHFALETGRASATPWFEMRKRRAAAVMLQLTEFRKHVELMLIQPSQRASSGTAFSLFATPSTDQLGSRPHTRHWRPSISRPLGQTTEQRDQLNQH
jgi:hypothetical protein